MLLANLRRVLESEALDRRELVGFLVALFIEEDHSLRNSIVAGDARIMLAELRPEDPLTRAIWDAAADRIVQINNTQRP